MPLLVMTRFIICVCVSELISLVPCRIGEHIRYYFYKNSLAWCGDDVVIGFGAILSYPNITIGNHVHIGVYNTFGQVDMGDFTQMAQYCNLLSGSHHHEFNDVNVPIMKQPSHLDRIKIGPDVWVGANITVMANAGHGCVIGAGSVVTKDIPPYSVATGNPASVLRSKK
jgi:virginiamycin A acetyltransferase